MGQIIRAPRLMIAAAGSGSGKTTVTCGLLQSLLLRGVNTVSFKCGPDYIDPMFHTEVLGIPSRNLDLFFTDEQTTAMLLGRAFTGGTAGGKGPDMAVIEGVMGYYDGLAAISTEASSYHLARATKTPVVLLLDCKGKSVSILAEIKGFMEYKEDSNIRGVILNRLSAMLYPDCKRMIEEELGVAVYGYIPVMDDCGLESRHLGLVTAKEVANLKEIITYLSLQMEKTVDVTGLISLAEGAPELVITENQEAAGGGPEAKGLPDKKTAGRETATEEAAAKGAECRGAAEAGWTESRETAAGAARWVERRGAAAGAARWAECRGAAAGWTGPDRVRIGVAEDRAFCFYYRDNLDLLEELGAELVPFSPLSDSALPGSLSGLIFGGGYPELYLERLSENWPLMEEIRFAIEDGIPCLAECGGFMYLHEWISDKAGGRFPMVGAIEGESHPTGRLGRFGYITLTARRDTILCAEGESIRGHEFHYWDSTNTGDCCTAKKPLRDRSWDCVLRDGKNSQGNLFAGYPHVHFYSNPHAASRFLEACRSFKAR